MSIKISVIGKECNSPTYEELVWSTVRGSQLSAPGPDERHWNPIVCKIV